MRTPATPFLALMLTISACTRSDDRPVSTVHNAQEPTGAANDTGPSSEGTATVEGTIRQILAIDQARAVVVFIPYTDAGIPTPTIALMRHDGSIGWSVALSHRLLEGRTSTGIEIVGDAVSVALAHAGELHDRLERIEIYSLADGNRRAVINPEIESYGRETIVDRDERYDVLIDTNGDHNLIVASDARGERWRTTLGEIPGVEVVALPEIIAVHEAEIMALGRWRVVSRRDGAIVGTVAGGSQTCSDGQRWFVLGREDLLEVDPSDLSTSVAMTIPTLSGSTDPTYMRDCTIIDGRPVTFVQRGMIEGLVSVSPTDGSIEHVMSLGIRRYREGAVYPLPDRLHPVVATISENEDSLIELGVEDIRRAGTSLEGGPQTWLGVQGLLPFDHGNSKGYVVAARGLMAVIDGETGELLGRHIRSDTMALHRSQLVEATLWLPPAAPAQLGRDAPTVLDLSQPSDDSTVRTAVRTVLSRSRSVTCGTLGRAGYDGLGTAPGLGRPSPSRLPPWNATHLEASARRFACASAEATVVPLAWSIEEDDRPLRNHNVLALVEDRVDGAPLYTAVSMYRHATNTAWNVSVSFHDPSRPIRRFTSRPTTADLDAFIEQSHFEFVSSWARVIVGNVVDSNWVAATGERPTQHFAAGIEQAD